MLSYGGQTFPSGVGALFDLNTLNGSNGFVIVGNGTDYIMGEMGIYSLGDINKDGLNDFAIGNRSYTPWNSVIIYGSRSFPSTLKVADLNGTNGFSISNSSRVTGLGDTNGDGVSDYAIGILDATVNGMANAGKVLIVTRGAISQYVACSIAILQMHYE